MANAVTTPSLAVPFGQHASVLRLSQDVLGELGNREA